MLRIVFIGVNSLYSTLHLRAVADAYKVTAVVEAVGPMTWLKKLQRRATGSRLARLSHEQGFSFQEVTHRDDKALTEVLRKAEPDVVVIAGMGWLMVEEALGVPRLGTINVHPSLLPAYRGAEPIFWQLFDGVTQSGVTVHLVDPAEDHGPVLRQESFPVPAGTSLSGFLACVLEVGPLVLVQALEALVRGTATPVAQPDTSPTRRARRLRSDDQCLIGWDRWSLEHTWQVLRGIGPILGVPKSRWRDLGWMPVIDMAVCEETGVPAGQLGCDAGGCFLGHPGGKIRFSYRWAPQSWLAAMYRGGAITGGIVAAEKAAWPPLRKAASPSTKRTQSSKVI